MRHIVCSHLVSMALIDIASKENKYGIKSLFVQLSVSVCLSACEQHQMFRRKPLIKTFCVFLFFSFDVLLVLFICDTEASIYEQDKADIIQQHSSALNGQHLIFIPSKVQLFYLL